MILIHRLTPSFLTLIAVAGFWAALHWRVPEAMLVAWIGVVLLYARLCRLSPRTFQFWYFVGTPGTFLLASYGFLLLLEADAARYALAVATAIPLLLFGELVFAYVHVPATYRAYSIEHLTLALNVLTVFFLSALMFGMGMLLQLPLWLLSSVFALAMLFVGYGTLWVSKVEGKAAFAYALALSALATELFAVVTYLPTGYLTDAALITVAVYVFLGLTRARFLDRLSDAVVRRYAAIGLGLTLVIMGGAHWV